MRMRAPKPTEILMASLSAIAVVAAVYAAHHWSRRGVCTDSLLCTTIAVLALIGLVILVRAALSCKGAQQMSGRPVNLVMVSGPREESKKERKIEGKMPEELDR